jgi:hypothetical protein
MTLLGNELQQNDLLLCIALEGGGVKAIGA